MPGGQVRRSALRQAPFRRARKSNSTMPISPRRTTMIRRIIFVAALTFVPFSTQAQTELKAYADADGYINVQKLTCNQLANTYQEDADFLGVWYSGWYNGLAKKSAINVPRVKENIHQVIVFCKANRDKRIIQAIDAVLKAEKARSAR
jgi:hypothetical protein